MTQRDDYQHLRTWPDTGVPVSRRGGYSGRGEAPIDMRSLRGVAALARRGGTHARLPRDLRPSGRVEAFVTLLLNENDDGCADYLFAMAERSQDPQEVARELLGPAARLVGDYWRMDVCDFMQVTVVMARVQRLFWGLTGMYPALAPCRPARTALLTPLPPEQHGFGLLVVEDALRRAGWQVDCCGVGEEEAYFDLIGSNSYALVGISVSGAAAASHLPAFMRKSRKISRNASARILVGGGLFVEKPELARDAGADCLALDAASAVRMAEAAVAAVGMTC